MDINLNNVEVSSEFHSEESKEILRNIKTIFTTPVGTVPFDRDFGIDWSLLDKPIHQAKGLLTIEYTEKVKRYEPRARVRQVTFKHRVDGTLIPKVVSDIESKGSA